MNRRTKRPHFVPKTYLDSFSENNSEIWVYDKREDTLQSQTTLSTGVSKKLYSGKNIHDPFEHQSVIDLEGTYKSILRKIISRDKPTPEELGKLLNFIVFQFLRTPSAKERHINAFNTFWSGIKKEYIRRKELGEETKNLEDVAKSFL